MFFIAWLRFFSPPLEALYSWLHIQDQACPQKGHSHFLAFAGIAYLYQTDSKNGLNFPLFEWNVNECPSSTFWRIQSEVPSAWSAPFTEIDGTICRGWILRGISDLKGLSELFISRLFFDGGRNVGISELFSSYLSYWNIDLP